MFGMDVTFVRRLRRWSRRVVLTDFRLFTSGAVSFTLVWLRPWWFTFFSPLCRLRWSRRFSVSSSVGLDCNAHIEQARREVAHFIWHKLRC